MPLFAHHQKSFFALYRLIFSFALILALLFFSVSRAQAAPPQLKIQGNQIVTASGGCTVRLRGVDLSGMEYSPIGDGGTGYPTTVLDSVTMTNYVAIIDEAVTVWHANCLRFPINQDFWFGGCGNPKASGENQTAYRDMIKAVINECSNLGVYLDLDLHWSGTSSTASAPCGSGWGTATGQQEMPDANSVTFWQSVGATYANNPAVLYDLYNEPYPGSWSILKNGGSAGSFTSPGLQALVSAVRGVGANNICVIGGLAWAYDLSPLATASNALTDTASSNGLLYSSHCYDNKTGGSSSTVGTAWDPNVTVITNNYPVIIEEFGPGTGYSSDDNNANWDNSALAWINGSNSKSYVYSAMAWAFSSDVGPTLLTSFSGYPTTSYHGAPVSTWLYQLNQTPTPNCGVAVNTPTFTPTATVTSTPTRTATVTVTKTTTATSTLTSSPTLTRTPTIAATATYTFSATFSPTKTVTFTPSLTATATLTPTKTVTSTPSFTTTVTLTPTNSLTASVTPTRTSTASPTATKTQTLAATFTHTATASPTGTVTLTPTITNTYQFSPTVTLTPTVTSSGTTTFTPTKTSTITSTPSPTATLSPTPSATLTKTSSPTLSPTATVSFTHTPTAQFTFTKTPTLTVTATPSSTATASPTSAFTSTLTATPTLSATPTKTQTLTATPTRTPTSAFTPTLTLTLTPSPTPQATVAILLSAAPASVSPGELMTYTIQLTISGGPSNNTQLVLNLPADVVVSGFTTGPSGSVGTSQVTWNLGTLAPGTYAYGVEVTVQGAASGTLTGQASVTDDQGTLLSNSSSVSVTAFTPTSTPSFVSTFTSTPTPSTGGGSNPPVLFPNPITGPGPVTIQLPNYPGTGVVTIQVFTTAFRMVNAPPPKSEPGGSQVTLPLTDKKGTPLADGLYYVLISSPAGKSIVKLLILR